MDINIQYHKWNKKQMNILSKSCYEILNIKEIQFYQPYFSLYFHIYNTKKSHKMIDLQRRFFLKEIIHLTNEKYHTSNIFVDCKIYDNQKNLEFSKELFCKCIPLLDPLYYIMNNYNNFVHRNKLLPSCYNYNTFQKINNMHNSAYIDTFLSYICSEITIQDLLPSFPIFYGAFNGIKEKFNFDISDDYDSLKNEYWFHKNMNQYDFIIDMYVSSDSEEEISSSDSSSDSDSDSDSNYGNNDYIIMLQDIPVQCFFIEKLHGTLEDLLDKDTMKVEIILSCIFQVSFALMFMQKYYKFTHNDLHINNIMYTSTDKTFLYYKLNNIYYKVPTFGYLYKIIDFGRSIFTFHKKLFFNDTFEKYGEAEGQYTEPKNHLNYETKRETIQQNFHFDLCRLAITILDVCGYDKDIDYKEKTQLFNFLYNMTLTESGDSLFDLEDDFDMYISISKYATNSLPKNILQNIIFNQYRVKKKYFPKKSYYSV